MKSGAYYHRFNEQILQCDLCPNSCRLRPEQYGYCHVRKYTDGAITSTIKHRYSAVSIDPVEKKPLYHFYPGHPILSLGTLGCNLRCHHCQNWHISQPHRRGFTHKLEMLPPEDVLDLCQQSQCHLIAFTYNEPTVNIESVLETSALSRSRENVGIALVTNGYINLSPLKDLAPLVDAFSIDLKAFDRDAYKTLCTVDAFDTVKQTITWLHSQGKHIELVTNLVTGINDDLRQLSQMAAWIRDLNPCIPWHISSYYPTYEYADRPPLNPDVVRQATKIGYDQGLYYVYSAYSETTRCPNCGKDLISRNRFTIMNNELRGHQCSFCNHDVPCMINH